MFITASVAISDTGIAIVGMIVVRQLCRKMKTTKHDEKQRLQQRDDDVMHGRRYEARRVVVHGVGDAAREALRQLLHLVLDALLKIERVRAGHLIDRQNNRRVLAEERRGGILQRAKLDAGDIAQPDGGAGARHSRAR